MSNTDTLQLVIRLISEICEVDAGIVKSEGTVVGYGLDSVRVLDLIMAVEEELDIEISESDPALAGVRTVADLAKLIDSRR